MNISQGNKSSGHMKHVCGGAVHTPEALWVSDHRAVYASFGMGIKTTFVLLPQLPSPPPPPKEGEEDDPSATTV